MKLFCFGCSLMLNLHRANWLIDTEQCNLVLWPYEVYHVWFGLKYNESNIAILTFYWILFKYIYFRKRFEIWFEIWPWTIWDLKKNGDLMFQLNDLNPFLERYKISVEDLIWHLPITGCSQRVHSGYASGTCASCFAKLILLEYCLAVKFIFTFANYIHNRSWWIDGLISKDC